MGKTKVIKKGKAKKPPQKRVINSRLI